ncbi:hypothetical protein [Streptomyces peucetius]|nr:hypothetical protein CGZ69_28050 [Streptomyces peucetius subsp. caesius ATCC 27952]
MKPTPESVDASLAGPPTRLRGQGHDQIVIAKQGGWALHSKVLAGYLEVVDQWEDNALLGVL